MTCNVVTSSLPPGWARTTLGEIRLDLSESLDPAGHKAQPFELYSVPSFDTGKPEVPRGADIGSSKRTVETATVLLCKINPRINRVWVVGHFRPLPKIASTEWIPFFPLAGLEPTYLRYFMNQHAFRDFLAGNVSGVGGSLMRVRASTFEDYQVPLPPTSEQRRIVAKIEELFSQLDAGVEELKKAKAQLKRYRQSVLKAAFEGKLTEEWRKAHKGKVEPASVLLERIKAERKKALGTKYKEPPPLDTSELPELSEGWEWARLDAIAAIKGGITKDAKRQVPGGRMVPYLRVANVQRGFLDLEEVTEILASKEEIDDLTLRPGDILFTEGGDRDKLGRGWVWQEELPLCIHQNHVFRARLYTADIQPKFVSRYGNIMGRAYFMGEGKQTTNLASINITKLSGLPVAVPPAKEEAEIVAKIEEQLSVVDAEDRTIDVALKQAARLRQSILKRAFEGKLVPQDPSDEPAERLLERIRAEKAKRAAGQPRGRGRRTAAVGK